MSHLAVALIGLVLAIGGAANPHLVRARQEIEELRLDRARASLAEALQAGGSSPTEVAEIHRLSGQVAASLDDQAAAERHFQALLALDPDAALPAGLSPKITRPFAAARAAMQGRALRLRHEPAPGRAAGVVLLVDADPLGMVAGARARYESPAGVTHSVEARGSGRIVIALPHAPRIALFLSAIDGHGNRLRDLGPIVVEQRPEPAPAPADAPGAGPADEGPRPRARPLYGRWWVWGAGAVALASAGLVFGLLANSAQDDLNRLNADSSNHNFSEARAAQSRGARDALVANVSFGVAGACAAAGTVLLVLQLRAPRAVIIPTPARGGAALSLATPF